MTDKITVKMDDADEAIAFIHNVPANYGNVLSYQHIGQHSEASIEYMREDCFYPRDAQDIIKAYKLLVEMQLIGYEIEGMED